jgi:hypothetical protein
MTWTADTSLDFVFDFKAKGFALRAKRGGEAQKRTADRASSADFFRGHYYTIYAPNSKRR